MRDTQQKLAIARGEPAAELPFENAKPVNVLSGEIHDANVGGEDGRIVGLGEYKAMRVINLRGAYLAPSLIDGHFQVESSMLTVEWIRRGSAASAC